jgi:hypothetical protein
MTAFMLYSAILLYAMFSSPTPDQIGWAEYGIAALLILANILRVGPSLIETHAIKTLDYNKWFLIYMALIPLGIGIIGGFSAYDILRDIIPLALLILPLCFYKDNLSGLSTVMTFAGFIFSIRYLFPILIDHSFFETDILLYLANAPLVLFSTIIGFSWFINPRLASVSCRLVGLLIFCAGFAAMALVVQRAPMALATFACLAIAGSAIIKTPIQTLILILVLAAVIFPFSALAIDLFQAGMDKTLLVGWNSRVEEFQAVIAKTSIFGHGWGATWQSPAVGDMWVRYTHNMISYYWLKAGIVGAFLSCLLIGMWLWQNIKLIRYDIAMGLALFVPLLIHTTLYTGFKTFDFALLLTLTALCIRNRNAS